MSIVTPFEPRRFESAAPYYLEGRPRYAERLFARVAGVLDLGPKSRLLDLGTGPGLLAIAFASYVGGVTAIDPEPEMLRIASDEARKAGVQLTLLEGSSFTLDDSVGRFDLVTIGRAFHWMDRPRTLEILDRLVRPGGAVALFGTRHPTVPENGWLKDYNDIHDRYSEAQSPARARRLPNWVPHETILLASPFRVLERVTVIERRLTPLEQFVTRSLSLSTSSPGRIGARAAEMTAAIRLALAPHATDGVISELVESEALMAFRPA